MTYQFYISSTLVSPTAHEVHPLNWLECTLNDEKERDQIFYRRKFNGALTFGGKKLCADYNLMLGFDSDPCQILYLLILKDGDSYWEGYFSTNMGDWDLDAQTFTVTPILIDDYSEWDDNGDTEFNIITGVATTVTTTAGDFTYTRNRWLISIIEYLAIQTFGAGTTVSSMFFTINPNYVTGLTNTYLNLTIAQKSDIKRWDSSGAASVAMLSFNEMMHILKMFNCYWTYNGSAVTVEHLSYFSQIDGMDLTTQELALSSNKYTYSSEKMPKYERFSFMEAIHTSFIGEPIWYNSRCVNQDVDSNTVEYTNRVTTDIEMIQTDEYSISDDGFVILANYLQGGSYYVYMTQSPLDTVAKYNTELSWGNLHNNFFKHGRVLEEGYMNRSLTQFASTIRTKRQEINALQCYPNDTDYYDPNRSIKTELGTTYFGGENGEVQRAEIHPDGLIKFTLLYGTTIGTSGESTPPTKSFTIIEQFVLHNNSYIRVELSEPAPYDMTFWIWIEEDTCQEIVVLEGEMWHSELMNALITYEPIEYGDVKYNLDSASLDGWTIHYRADDQTEADLAAYPILTVTDADCGSSGTEPPPPVAPTATITVKAGETWTIDNDSAVIAYGSTSLTISFKPHDCTLPGSHLVYIQVKRNTVIDTYSTVYAKETYQCNKTISVTQAGSGDAYEVELSETSYT